MSQRPSAPKHTRAHTRAVFTRWATLVVVATASASALAQGVYRIVGPDGRVTFSDQPPAPDAAPAVQAAAASGSRNDAALPFALRQVATRFPVVLYTGTNCAPCDSGRAMLSARGIPFTEKTVTTGNDSEALKRLSGDTTLPFLTIGGQQIKGYSDAEWTQFLNAAGYPRQSALPATYRRPAPTPLVAAQSVEPTAPAGAQPPAADAGAPPASTGDNVPVTPQSPTGIRF